MTTTMTSPRLPNQGDTVDLVLDGFGKFGQADPRQADRQTGQYECPLRIVATGWSNLMEALRRSVAEDTKGAAARKGASDPGAQTGVSAIAHRAAMLPLADSRDGTVYLVLDPLRVVAFKPPTAGCATSPRTSHASCDFVERAGA